MSSTDGTDDQRAYPKCLDLNFIEGETKIKTIDLFQINLEQPRLSSSDKDKLNKIQGSLIGLSLGDALGAHAEFRPGEYLAQNPITDLKGGGTWGLKKGQFTDDTSMALCLASSLVACGDFIPYDQLVRYKWWYQHGYLSSTGECFDIGTATNEALHRFLERQGKHSKHHSIDSNLLDDYSRVKQFDQFNVFCGDSEAAGNGALMRLAPAPLFFHRNLFEAIEFSGRSGEITHASPIAVDACRYFAALIVKALENKSKEYLTEDFFYEKHRLWFGEKGLVKEIRRVANGSYKKPGGYQDGIRGKGFVVQSLEAALWAFWSTNDFRSGALAAVNLGDDTDTTAAIYGQLAGAFYGYEQLPQDWLQDLYGKDFILMMSRWICHKGRLWNENHWNKQSVVEF